ncbi:MAG: hypothetical protein ABIJ57_09340 [Pseudomonadota bacterium]
MSVVLLLVIGFSARADWIFNPFTGKLDYHSGVSAPGSYIASPSADNLRDFLIAVGLMDAAPAAPLVIGGIEFEERLFIEWEDRAEIEFEDR